MLTILLSMAAVAALWGLSRAIFSLKKEQEQSARFAAMLLDAQERERKRIARELHDETSQVLTRLMFGLETLVRAMPERAKELNALKALTAQSLEELRQIMFTLRPSLLDDIGLKAALSELLREKLGNKNIQTTFSFESEEKKFPPEIEIALFRIAEEAVSNIEKYAHAAHAELLLRQVNGKIDMVISDDGAGFDPRAVSQNQYGRLGLLGIEERVSILKGDYEIQTAPGEGTTLSVSLPRKGFSASADELKTK